MAKPARRKLEIFMAFVLLLSALVFLQMEYRQSKTAITKMKSELKEYIKQLNRDLADKNTETGNVITATKPTGVAYFPNLKKVNKQKPKQIIDKNQICPEKHSSLVGFIKVNITRYEQEADVEPCEKNTTFVGHWKPNICKPRAKVAILVPLRNRPKQLKIFLKHIIPVLQRQLLQYRIFVIEQVGKTAFNKGAIYNLGFNTSLRYDNYDCYIFHDVDLLTENDYNYYGCPASPLHMSVAIDKFKYKLPYPNIFGGIQAFKKEHYIKVNGFSNQYWGWGAEDDDMFRRVKKTGLKVQRAKLDIGRYKMNQGEHYRSPGRKIWEARNKGLLFYHPTVFSSEGLNSTSTLTFDMKIQEKKLYTYISIDLTFTG